MIWDRSKQDSESIFSFADYDMIFPTSFFFKLCHIDDMEQSADQLSAEQVPTPMLLSMQFHVRWERLHCFGHSLPTD